MFSRLEYPLAIAGNLKMKVIELQKLCSTQLDWNMDFHLAVRTEALWVVVNYVIDLSWNRLLEDPSGYTVMKFP